MARNRRLMQELSEIKSADYDILKDIQFEESNISSWTALILPQLPPYNKGSFKISIDFPDRYPFRPPDIKFITKIYHPNIDEDGTICWDGLNVENWRPSTKVYQLVLSIFSLLNQADEENLARNDIFIMFRDKRQEFIKKAEEHTLQYAIKRIG